LAERDLGLFEGDLQAEIRRPEDRVGLRCIHRGTEEVHRTGTDRRIREVHQMVAYGVVKSEMNIVRERLSLGEQDVGDTRRRRHDRVVTATLELLMNLVERVPDFM